MTGTRPRPGAGRGLLTAVLGLALDAELSGRAVALPELRHPWDAWWLAVRSEGIAPLRPGSCGACPACVDRVAAMTLGHRFCLGPEEPVCGCHATWAKAMRAPLPRSHLPAPPQRLTLALIKPGAPRPAIRARLRAMLREVAVGERELSSADCARLYPDAYGADYVIRRTAYLTASSVLVLVLAGEPDAVNCGTALKGVIRSELGADTTPQPLAHARQPGRSPG